MKLARLTFTLDRPETLLELPEGVTIERVYIYMPGEYETSPQRRIGLVLSGEVLPVGDLREGELIPEISVVVNTENGARRLES